ncbi:MAG: 2-dehydropantoate 2-reductase [Streptosporangiales bacterium]|nr:2-dehydropantoate 2-reductase [Streptosporangiales bacterium]
MDATTGGGREPVAVIGLGAVGTVLAAELAAAGHPVLACGRQAVHTVAVTERDDTRRFPVQCVTDPASTGQVPWVVLATKMHQTSAAADWLRATTGPETHVIVAQNGVDQRERVAPLVGPATVVPALVYLNAERTGPGEVRARRSRGRNLVLPDDAGGRAVAALCRDTSLRPELAPDFHTAAWRKLLANVAANPITALTGRRVEVLTEPAVAELATAVLCETVAVGRAVGADLTPEHAAETLRWLQGLTSGSTTSMLQDRQAGRPLEYDGLTGIVVRLGDEHGVPVNADRALLALLSALPRAGS